MLAITYDNILQLYHHNDYDQATYGRASARKVKLFVGSLFIYKLIINSFD
jgi:hypothetical protein